jgi:hypothetical protein
MGLIAGDGNVHIIDKEENVWPLRRFMANILLWNINNEFAASQMRFADEPSNLFNNFNLVQVNIVLRWNPISLQN